MKKNCFLAVVSFLIMGYATLSLGSQPIFNITNNTPVTQNMVPSSTQGLSYTINVPFPPQTSGNEIVIKCALSIDDTSIVSAPNFNTTTNGCINGSGFSGIVTSALVNIPLVANAPGTTNMTLTFTMTNAGGTHKVPAPPVTISSPITVTANANRTMTFKNYCPFPVFFGLSSGSAPAKNAQTTNTACTTDSDCTALSAFAQCQNNGYCGGGFCVNNNDAGYNSTSTDCQVTTDPNSSPSASDLSPCAANTCTYCNSNTDCIAGSSCSSSNHQCYWNPPAPSDSSTNHYQLTAYSGSGAPAQDSVTFTSYSSTNGYSLLWSGGVAGRTGCGNGTAAIPYTGINSCLTGGCNLGSDPGTDDSANGGCYLGQGFGSSSTSSGGANPVTQAEFTLVTLTPDTYDVTVINGTNIPVNMYPITDGTGAAIASPATYGNPFQCGSTGSNLATSMSPASPTTTLGACSWNFENSFLTSNYPLNLAYRWVGNENTTACIADSTCTALNTNYRCGLTSSAVGNTGSGSAQTTCGNLLGYWTQDEICAANATYNPTGNPSTEIVNCTAGTGGTLGGNTLINLLSCTGPANQSCYTAGANSSICGGCTDWTQVTGVPSSPSVITACTTPNTQYWVANVLPGLNFLKEACPSAYVYPYDDKASTLTCPQNSGQNGVDYVVEFCPGGETGGYTGG